MIRQAIICVLLTMFWAMVALGAPGCMSKSRELSQRYDYKNYAFVQCNCPCGKSPRYKILADRGQCIYCRHYRDARPIYLVNPQEMSVPTSFVRHIQERKRHL